MNKSAVIMIILWKIRKKERKRDWRRGKEEAPNKEETRRGFECENSPKVAIKPRANKRAKYRLCFHT